MLRVQIRGLRWQYCAASGVHTDMATPGADCVLTVTKKPGMAAKYDKYCGEYTALVGKIVLDHQVYYSSSSHQYLTPTKDIYGNGSEWWTLQDTPGPGGSRSGYDVSEVSEARCPAVAWDPYFHITCATHTT